jgi:hypothetical protein
VGESFFPDRLKLPKPNQRPVCGMPPMAAPKSTHPPSTVAINPSPPHHGRSVAVVGAPSDLAPLPVLIFACLRVWTFRATQIAAIPALQRPIPKPGPP